VSLTAHAYEFTLQQDWQLPVEHLSPSSLGMLARCPEQWRNRYCLGRKERPGEALVLGTAIHSTAERNFSQKITTYQDVPIPELVEWYEDEGFAAAVAREEERNEFDVRWDTDPERARERGRSIIYAYQFQVAPRVQPLAVEERVEADFGLPVPVIGYSDARTAQQVIDLKTGKQARKKIKPHWRFQAGVYSTIAELPCDFHTCAATEKGKATITTPLESPELSVYLPPVARAELMRTVRSMGWLANHLYTTLGPDHPWPTWGQQHDWACGWCGFRGGCPAWKGIDT
jgi:hypothetical protein